MIGMKVMPAFNLLFMVLYMKKPIVETVLKAFKLVTKDAEGNERITLKLPDPRLQSSKGQGKDKEYITLSKGTRVFDAFKNDGRITIQIAGQSDQERFLNLKYLQAQLDLAIRYGNFEITLFDAKHFDDSEKKGTDIPKSPEEEGGF